MPEKTDKPVVIPLEKLMHTGQVLFKSADGRLWYLDETKPGVYLLRVWQEPPAKED